MVAGALGQTIVQAWAAIPAAGAIMLMIAGHMARIEVRAAPLSRRRIRLANGWVMLFVTPLLAAGLGLFDPRAQQRAFVLTWTMVAALLVVAIVLAGVDAGLTLRLARREMRRLKRDSALAALQDVRDRRKAAAKRSGAEHGTG